MLLVIVSELSCFKTIIFMLDLSGSRVDVKSILVVLAGETEVRIFVEGNFIQNVF
jgi:hypothetical protein